MSKKSTDRPSTTLRFNPPPEQAKKLPRYASYAAGEMKTHAGIGFAKNSLNNRMWTWTGSRENGDRRRVTTYAAILENIGGSWYTLYEVKEGSEFKDLPWVKAQFRTTYGYGFLNVEDYKGSTYYGPKLESGEFPTVYNAVPMTRDEYVAFRLEVAREQWEEEINKVRGF